MKGSKGHTVQVMGLREVATSKSHHNRRDTDMSHFLGINTTIKNVSEKMQGRMTTDQWLLWPLWNSANFLFPQHMHDKLYHMDDLT